jgi:Asp/Glu/hydantoin racemase
MKIWYQALSPSAQVDPAWRMYEEACERYVPTLARPQTEIHFATADTRAPKMVLSNYVKYLHLRQVIENAIHCERAGYDAFILGGMGDLGYAELREVVEIPVVFIAETAFLVASLLARRFAVINGDLRALQSAMALVKGYGLDDRAVPGAHLGRGPAELMALMESSPQQVIDEFKVAAASAINEGAEILVPGIAPISVFLMDRGVRAIDGVPILDIQAAVIKIAEMTVDLRRLGMPKPRKARALGVSREDIQIARKVYGLE